MRADRGRPCSRCAAPLAASAPFRRVPSQCLVAGVRAARTARRARRHRAARLSPARSRIARRFAPHASARAATLCGRHRAAGRHAPLDRDSPATNGSSMRASSSGTCARSCSARRRCIELDRFSGRYRDAAQEAEAPKSVIALSNPTRLDLWQIKQIVPTLAALGRCRLRQRRVPAADRRRAIQRDAGRRRRARRAAGRCRDRREAADDGLVKAD